ncbi:CoA transferase [Dactylosporangium sp. NPDC050688]|uniref:CaiB/BaiF CoA transferase family protein n=1 Tax=Dactylosporangium sp. NPDC050688 TaxID=3157217 RepID=UPI00340BFBF0
MAPAGPLTGLRVIDASTVLAGPLLAQLLGDYGADVIKVEHPAKPDSLRTHGHQRDGHGLWWKMVGRNKRCVGLYLGDPEVQDIFLRLVASADVLVENFRPGTLERWGLGWDRLSAVNPGLVLVRVTGFGQRGPYSARPGFGTLAEAMSGFAAMTGEPEGPPTLPPFGLADAVAGTTGFGVVLAALYHRDARGGRGQVVDLDILSPLVSVLGPQPIGYDQLGIVPQRTGNRSVNNAPRNTYRTSDDNWVAISTSANSVAERLMRLVGHPEVIDEPWFSSGAERALRVDLLDGHVGEWVAARTRAEVLDACERADVAVAPIYDVADLMADPHVVATGMITTVEDPDLGPVRMQDVVTRLSETPGSIRFTGRAPYADTEEILRKEAGVDDTTLANLIGRGVVA